MSGINNQARGEINFQLLSAYFDRVGPNIPKKPDGSPDITKLVREVPLNSRGIIYQNARNRALCNERFALHQIPAIADQDGVALYSLPRPGVADVDEEKKQLRRRVDQLERDLTVARGEVAELRRAMRQFKALEMHLADTGHLPR